MTAQPPPIPSRPFRFTREQYYEMDRLGYFDRKRVELIYGEIVEMSPVNWPHALGVKLVSDALARAFTTGHWISAQQPISLSGIVPGSEPQPDVAVIPGSPRDYKDHPTAAVLVVEVSDSTLAYDTTTKAELYATAGVPEYWVIDVTGRQLIVFRDPQSLAAPLGAVAYQDRRTLAPGDGISPLGAPSVTVAVTDLLP